MNSHEVIKGEEKSNAGILQRGSEFVRNYLKSRPAMIAVSFALIFALAGCGGDTSGGQSVDKVINPPPTPTLDNTSMLPNFEDIVAVETADAQKIQEEISAQQTAVAGVSPEQALATPPPKPTEELWAPEVIPLPGVLPEETASSNGL